MESCHCVQELGPLYPLLGQQACGPSKAVNLTTQNLITITSEIPTDIVSIPMQIIIALLTTFNIAHLMGDILEAGEFPRASTRPASGGRPSTAPGTTSRISRSMISPLKSRDTCDYVIKIRASKDELTVGKALNHTPTRSIFMEPLYPKQAFEPFKEACAKSKELEYSRTHLHLN
ncbi:hypothetical protein QAD02_008047 [Eretmocerus hayati]|uniref:Uncharacterized protein n=1 Tax=Eretmocerus hayati TaxID=131215 RepID=A0ACC2N5B2_9HYME|nr:hypothetical protein QAD02_008047 [Eretmocerus hayati]